MINPKFTYLLLDAAVIFFPLILSFDKKVAFWKKWKYVLPASIVPALIYIAWDIFFTQQGVWSFNPAYITGLHISNLPLEEVLFFFIVPYCCVFIYECIRCYFPLLKDNHKADVFMWLMAFVLLVTGIIYHDRYYTSWTFIFNAVFIAALYVFRNFFRSFDAISFLVSYAICLIPFLVVNGFLTAIPVVLYNDAENLGRRIYTIPFEDCFYGMLLVLMNVVLFEKLRTK